jgi:hypothetical protein
VASSRLEGANLAIGIVALVAAIVGSAAAVVALVGHDSAAPESGSATSPPASAPAPSASTATAPTGTPTADLLSRLTPTLGGPRLTELPDALCDKADYADSVAIACASTKAATRRPK